MEVINATTVRIKLASSKKERIVHTTHVFHASERDYKKYRHKDRVLLSVVNSDSDSSDDSDEDSGTHNRDDPVDDELEQAIAQARAIRPNLIEKGIVLMHDSCKCPVFEVMEMLIALLDPRMQQACKFKYGSLDNIIIVVGESGSGKTVACKLAIADLVDNPTTVTALVNITPDLVGPGKYHGEAQAKIKNIMERVERLAKARAPNSSDGKEREVVVVVMWDELAASIMPSEKSDSGESGFYAGLRQWLDNLPDNVIILGTSCEHNFEDLDPQEKRRFLKLCMPELTQESICQFLLSVAKEHNLFLDVSHHQLALVAKYLLDNNISLWQMSRLLKQLKWEHNRAFIREYKDHEGPLPVFSQLVSYNTIFGAAQALTD